MSLIHFHYYFAQTMQCQLYSNTCTVYSRLGWLFFTSLQCILTLCRLTDQLVNKIPSTDVGITPGSGTDIILFTSQICLIHHPLHYNSFK